MFYLIKSIVPIKKPSEITHEVLHIDHDKDICIRELSKYIPTQKCKSKKILGDYISYNQDDVVVTIIIHEHNDKPLLMSEFLDTEESGYENIEDTPPSSYTRDFINFKSNMTRGEIDDYVDRVKTIHNQHTKETQTITLEYNKLIKKKEKHEKPLTLKF